MKRTIFVTLLLVGVGFFYFPGKLIYGHFASNTFSYFSVSPSKLVSSSNHNFSDVIFDKPDHLSGIYYDLQKEMFRAETYALNGEKWILEKSDQDVPESHAPLFHSTYQQSAFHQKIFTVNDNGLSRIAVVTEGKTNIFCFAQFEMSDPSLDEHGFYFTFVSNRLLRLAHYEAPTKTFSVLPMPVKKGIVYSPFEWSPGKTLFYQGMQYVQYGKPSEGFLKLLYLSNANKPLMAFTLAKVDEMEPSSFAVSGSANGQFFAHLDGLSEEAGFWLHDMTAFPFPPRKVKGTGQKPLRGRQFIPTPELANIYSLAFCQETDSQIALVASAKGSDLNLIFVYDFKLSKPHETSFTLSDLVIGLIASLCATLILFLAFRLSRRQ